MMSGSILRYFLVSPECVAPPNLAPSVNVPVFKHLANFSSHAAPPPRLSQVDFQSEQDAARADIELNATTARAIQSDFIEHL
jgi:hypothetical protein